MPPSKSEIAEALEQSREEFLAAARVPESLAGLAPAEGRWSVVECLEHVIAVEESFLERLKPMEGSPPLDSAKEAELATRLEDRTERREAPEAVKPAGRFATLEEALSRFQAARARTLEFAAEHASDLLSVHRHIPSLGSDERTRGDAVARGPLTPARGAES